jgi:peptidyl-prolyl cis-trans isomerase B (cyclophilin B)
MIFEGSAGVASKTRQRRLARAKVERQQARRARQARRSRQVRAGVAVGLVVVVGVVLGLWAGGVFTSPKKPIVTASCGWNTPANTKTLTNVGQPPVSGEPRTGTETMAITTDQGAIDVSLNLAESPCAASSLSYLAKKNFYNNTKCNRLTTAGTFILNCGDPKGDGTGGPTYTFADEYLPSPVPPSAAPSTDPSASADPSASPSAPSTVVYPAGTVAMSNNAPDTNGSQFFIVYKDSTFPPNYTIVGTVASGLDVVTKVAAGGAVDSTGKATNDGTPKTTTTIQTLTVTAPASPAPSPAATASATASATGSPAASTQS